MAMSNPSLPYHEPDIVVILILTSFLLIANIINWALDRIVYCGLIGQILIGIAWGTPGGKWLDESVEKTIVQFGYLGLILLVYEGGLSTSYQSLKANLVLSIGVAITGIAAPIGLSFILGSLVNAGPLQSFAAGAALCSTSLGTTFTILGTTGLLKTRLGVVLTSAAMLDDVVGLVMVQVINNLGRSTSDFSAATVVRPVFVSLGFAIICPVVCWLVLKPVTLRLNTSRERKPDGFLDKALKRDEIVFGLQTTLLVGMVTASSYAGTSNLFAAYLAGAVISWWDTEVPHVSKGDAQGHSSQEETKDSSANGEHEHTFVSTNSGAAIFEKYYMAANDRILKPFFFTSIGFSIPITRMFSGAVVWRGVIYSILMLFGKLICGAWLIRLSLSLPYPVVLQKASKAIRSAQIPHLWGRRNSHDTTSTSSASPRDNDAPAVTSEAPSDANAPLASRSQLKATENNTIAPSIANTQDATTNPDISTPYQNITTSALSNPLSLYPAAILGLAMVARGEIGFLISSLAESNGIFSSGGNEQVFLIVTWAIVLCTLIGPVCVGLLVRRVKTLERERVGRGDGRYVLGVWGLE